MQYMCVCVYMYTVCSCVMSAYTENLKAHAKKLLELVSNYIKIAGNKVNIYKKSTSNTHVHIQNKRKEGKSDTHKTFL